MTDNLILAPLRGVTGHVFRQAFAHVFGGFDYAIAPFVTSVRGDSVKRSHIRDFWPENNRALPVIPQVIGNDPDQFVVMARALQDLGYVEVNWNLGCPFVKVARKKRGSGLLPYPDRIDSFLQSVVPRIPIRLSVKTRLGYSSDTELIRLMPTLNRYPLASVTIHARLGVRMYDGPVDPDTFGACAAQCTHPVVYNGDITSSSFFSQLAERFPTITSWMIGRAAVANPFLAPRIRRNDRFAHDTKIDMLQRFHQELLYGYREIMHGPGPLLGVMKELWNYLAGSFVDGGKILKKVRKCSRVETYEAIVDDFFSDGPRWRPGEQPGGCHTL